MPSSEATLSQLADAAGAGIRDRQRREEDQDGDKPISEPTSGRRSSSPVKE